MNNEILSQLRDVHLPGSPSWWPPAVGYYIVVFLIVLLIFLGWLFYRKTHPGRLIKRQAKAELLKAERQYRRTQEVGPLQAEVSSIVRRLAAYKAHSPVLLSHEPADLYKGVKAVYPNAKKAQELLVLLEKDRYQKEGQVDGQRLILLAHELVKQCRI